MGNEKVKKTLATVGVAGLMASVAVLQTGCSKSEQKEAAKETGQNVEAKASCGQGSCGAKTDTSKKGSCGQGSCGGQ